MATMSAASTPSRRPMSRPLTTNPGSNMRDASSSQSRVAGSGLGDGRPRLAGRSRGLDRRSQAHLSVRPPERGRGTIARPMTHHATEHLHPLTEAAQGYLLALRVMTEGGATTMVSAVARQMGVSTQAASEMIGRLSADGLVAVGPDRELTLTATGRVRGGDHLPPALPPGVAADQGHRARLGRIGRGGRATPGLHLAPGRGGHRGPPRSPTHLSARQPHRRRGGPHAGRRASGSPRSSPDRR